MATCNLISGQIKKILIDLKLHFRITGKSWNKRDPVLTPHLWVLPAQHPLVSRETYLLRLAPSPAMQDSPGPSIPSLLKLRFLKTMRDCG